MRSRYWYSPSSSLEHSLNTSSGMLLSSITSRDLTQSGFSSFNAMYIITTARCLFLKRLKRVKSNSAKLESISTIFRNFQLCCSIGSPANWWIVGNCRLKLIAERITPSITKSWSTVYSPSQTKMYLEASQVWISLYFEATKSEATPSSWKLALLMRCDSKTRTQSIICTQMCSVSCFI